MIKAVILDDEEKGSQLLAHKLKAFSSIISVERIFNDVESAVKDLSILDVDVLFLDIEMPQMNGFQFLERLGKFKFEVIFVTAYNAYVLDALRANALDYLLKPVDPEELASALNKLKTKIDQRLQQRNIDSQTHGNQQSRIALATLEGIYFVKKSEIIRVEAMSNYSVFYILSKSKIIVSKTLKDYESILCGDSFVRVNRGVIVNIDFVEKYKKGDGGTLVLLDGSEIEVSSTKKLALLEKLLDN